MTEQELYNYYYNNYIRDIDDLFNGKVKSRLYLGTTSKEADKLASDTLPEDEWSRNIISRAASDALKAKGYDYNKLYAGGSPLTYSQTHPRRWTPIKDRRLGNSLALATLEKLNKKGDYKERAGIANPNGLQQDPNQLALNIISAMQAGQPIDDYIAMVQDGANDLYKSAFIYTLASNYPAKTPEVSKEMQALAARHKLKAQQWKASRQDKLGMNDLLTLGGYANKQTVKRGKDK